MAIVDYFLTMDGIEGETLDPKSKGAIAVESWSFGAENKPTTTSASGGAGAGKVNLQEFKFMTRANKASVKLLVACATGKLIKTAVLTCRKAGKEQEFLKITLSDLVVTSFKAEGTRGADTLPSDEVSLAFGRILYEYKEQKSDGTLAPPLSGGWDVVTNKPVER
jgi:type VI secretion system secreted protein Hcp